MGKRKKLDEQITLLQKQSKIVDKIGQDKEIQAKADAEKEAEKIRIASEQNPYNVFGRDFSVTTPKMVEYYKDRMRMMALKYKLVGRVDDNGLYVITRDIRLDLINMKKGIEEQGDDYYKASALYMKKYFNFSIKLTMTDEGKAKASLYLIEFVGENTDEQYIYSHIADFVDDFNDEFRIKLRRAFNLYDVEVKNDDFNIPNLAVMMQDLFDIDMYIGGLYDMASQIYVIRMLKLLEGGGAAEKQILAKYRELVEKYEKGELDEGLETADIEFDEQGQPKKVVTKKEKEENKEESDKEKKGNKEPEKKENEQEKQDKDKNEDQKNQQNQEPVVAKKVKGKKKKAEEKQEDLIKAKYKELLDKAIDLAGGMEQLGVDAKELGKVVGEINKTDDAITELTVAGVPETRIVEVAGPDIDKDEKSGGKPTKKKKSSGGNSVKSEKPKKKAAAKAKPAAADKSSGGGVVYKSYSEKDKESAQSTSGSSNESQSSDAKAKPSNSTTQPEEGQNKGKEREDDATGERQVPPAEKEKDLFDSLNDRADEKAGGEVDKDLNDDAENETDQDLSFDDEGGEGAAVPKKKIHETTPRAHESGDIPVEDEYENE